MIQAIRKISVILFFAISIGLNACQPPLEPLIRSQTTITESAIILKPTHEEKPSPLQLITKEMPDSTNTPQLSATSSNADTLQEIKRVEFSSPLQGIEISELPLIISNPFVSPTQGQDDGHQGVDFSFYQYRDFSGILHHEIDSVLPGKISAIVKDRPPYGNALIIETELSRLSDVSREKINALNFDSTVHSSSFINCPTDYTAIVNHFDSTESIYVLYAHMEDLPLFEVGDEILPLQKIGRVGNTGMSGNPHLHLETRIGPSHATFPSMAHYDNSVTNEEVENYCLWRVSNIFHLIDPMIFYN